jgi:hypothetical protein
LSPPVFRDDVPGLRRLNTSSWCRLSTYALEHRAKIKSTIDTLGKRYFIRTLAQRRTKRFSLIDDPLRLLLLLFLDTRRHDSFYIYYRGKSGWTSWLTRLAYSLEKVIRWRNPFAKAGLITRHGRYEGEIVGKGLEGGGGVEETWYCAFVCRRRACLSRDEEGLGRDGVGEDGGLEG